MIAVKAKFDGKQVILPDGFDPPNVGEVIVLFDTDDWNTADPEYMKAAEEAFQKIWNNPDDEVFNSM